MQEFTEEQYQKWLTDLTHDERSAVERYANELIVERSKVICSNCDEKVIAFSLGWGCPRCYCDI